MCPYTVWRTFGEVLCSRSQRTIAERSYTWPSLAETAQHKCSRTSSGSALSRILLLDPIQIWETMSQCGRPCDKQFLLQLTFLDRLSTYGRDVRCIWFPDTSASVVAMWLHERDEETILVGADFIERSKSLHTWRFFVAHLHSKRNNEFQAFTDVLQTHCTEYDLLTSLSAWPQQFVNGER